MLNLRCHALEESLHLARRKLDAQNLIIEAQNAQLIIQNMGMEKMNATLHAKTKEKESERTVLFPGGKGQHLTDGKMIQKKRQLEEDKRQEELAKEERRNAKENHRAEKELLDEQWKQLLERYAETVVLWEMECQRLRKAGTRVKDLSKKPKRPLKPKLIQTGGENGGDEDDKDEDVVED
ncbi:hypothetical protein H0H93_005504 [Arthromyces matolae]|nr:hypothetical protein H0H93_005504 [Arthromyces matolae]